MVPVRRLARHCNPFDPVWDTPDLRRHRITLAQVRKCIELRQFEPTPFNPASDCPTWRLSRHARRVAYLAVHGWGDPIHIDVGVPAMCCHVDWLVEDGNHRLAAAIVRNDEHIASIISGSHDYCREILGVAPR
ncbi:hypothetical protein [Paucibacter soli]|uniref:hypothetical protein n=1 Tax=Paucibacter soli TaxID=3133433 RepID=UPI0030B7A2CE